VTATLVGSLRRVNVLGMLTMLALIGLWEVVVRWVLPVFQFLPAPSAIAEGAVVLLASAEFLPDVLHTLGSALVGWLAAAVIGVGLGVWLGLSDTAWRYSMASAEAVRAIPPVTVIPVAVLIFGFSVQVEFTVIVYVGAWTVLVNTIGGVRGVRPELLDVARMLRLPAFTTLRKIILPAAVPSIVVGLRLALSLSLVLAVVAEMIGNPDGLGHALILAQLALQPEQMFAHVVAIGLLGVALDATFTGAVRWALPTAAGGPGRSI
jgi:sulfonate transport system permease protein